jgi:hypothetical protein
MIWQAARRKSFESRSSSLKTHDARMVRGYGVRFLSNLGKKGLRLGSGQHALNISPRLFLVKQFVLLPVTMR